MGMAICDLGWSPEQFWRSTPHELYSACEVAFSRTEEGKKRAREKKFAKFKAGLEAAGVA